MRLALMTVAFSSYLVALVDSKAGTSHIHDHNPFVRHLDHLHKRGAVRCPTNFHNRTKYIASSSILLTSQQISLVTEQLEAHADYSWEVGTMETALFELNAPDMFIYSANSIPPILSSSSNVSDIWRSVNKVIDQKSADVVTFFQDTATGDPASVGIPFLIYNWTLGQSTSKYGAAASQELNYLLNDVPRSSSGAISQRAPPQSVQLWADFCSMAPPFIAYYGAIQNDQSILIEGYTQLELYYNALYDPNAQLLRHIVLGDGGQDHGHWATGNGWALNGMIRVARIIQLSAFADNLVSQQQNLISWAASLLQTIWTYQQDNGALLNYIDESPYDTFYDASATALIAASTFRLATLVYGTPNMPSVNVQAAELARVWIVGQVGSDGWLAPVVDPLDWHQQGEHSPEAQAFVLMLTAAYRDWYDTTGGYYY